MLIDSFMEWFPDRGGCRFFIGGNPQSKNWLMLEPLLWFSLIRQNIRDLERLKEIMERGKYGIAPS